MTARTLNAEELALLRKIDSPTVANVIELFDIRSYVAGYTNLTLKAIYPKLPPAVGYAVTATFRSAYPAQQGDSYGGMSSLIADAMGPPAPRMVVFQDFDDPPQAATYGEVMATALKTFGFAGLITSGGARDIEQVDRLQFPCWASSVIVSHGYCRIQEVNVPVCVGGLEVRPGDLLHADANGVVNIPHEIASAVAALCEPFIEAEDIILGYLKGPQPTPEGYAEAVRKSKQRIGELRGRARELWKGKA